MTPPNRHTHIHTHTPIQKSTELGAVGQGVKCDPSTSVLRMKVEYVF